MNNASSVERVVQAAMIIYEETDYFHDIHRHNSPLDSVSRDVHGYFPNGSIKLNSSHIFVGNAVVLDGLVLPQMVGPSICLVEYKKELHEAYSELIRIEPWKFTLDMEERQESTPQVVFKANGRLNGSLDKTLYDGYYKVSLFLDDLKRIPYDGEDLSYDLSPSARARMTLGCVLKYHHHNKPPSVGTASGTGNGLKMRPALPALSISNTSIINGSRDAKDLSPSNKNHRPSLPERVILPLPKPAVPMLNLSVGTSSSSPAGGSARQNGIRSSAAAALFLQQEAESLGPLFAKAESKDSADSAEEGALNRTKSDDSLEKNIQNEIAALEAYIPKILRNQILGQITWNCIDTLLSENAIRFENSNQASIERFHGVMLFVDISGFTSLSLCMNVETFKNSINEYFTTMLKIVQEEEGEVIKFAGDALFILWQTESVESEESFRIASLTAADKAITCGLRISEVCNNYPVYYDEVSDSGMNGASAGSFGVGDVKRANSEGGGSTPRGGGVLLTPRGGASNTPVNKSLVYLNVHSGISTGIMAGIDVGDIDRWEYFLVGDPITEALHAEKLAEPGSLVCGPSIHQLYHEGSRVKPLSPGTRENSNRTPFSPAPAPKGRKTSLVGSLFEAVVDDSDITAALGLVPSETEVIPIESSVSPKNSALPPLSGLKNPTNACNFQFIAQYRSDESLGSANSEESREGYYKVMARKSVSSTRTNPILGENGRPLLRRSKSSESPSIAQLDQLVNLSSKYIASTLSINGSPSNSVHGLSRNSSSTLAASGRGNSSSFEDIPYSKSNSNDTSTSNLMSNEMNMENLPPPPDAELQADLALGPDGKLFQALDNELFCTKSLPDTVRSIPENIKLQIIGALENHVHEVVRSSLVLTSHMLEYYHHDHSDGQSTSTTTSLMLTERDSDDDSDYYSSSDEEGGALKRTKSNEKLERKDGKAFPAMDSILTAELRQVVVLFIKIDLEVHLRFSDTEEMDFSKPAFTASMSDQDKESFVLPNMPELNFIPRTEEEYNSDIRLLGTLQRCFAIIVRAFRLKGGQIRQFIVDDKGTVCIGSFGLRGSTTENDSATASEVANSILKELQAEHMNASIGITTGKAYCGLVGSPERHEYAIMSPSTNLSARMCCAASKKVGTILCDSETKDRDRYHYFKAADSIKAKGYSEAVPTFIPLFQDEHGGFHPRLGESFDYLADTYSNYSIGSSNSPSRRNSRNSYFFNKPIAVNSLAGKLKTMSDLDYNLDLISSNYEANTAAPLDTDVSNIHGRRKDCDLVLRFVFPGYQSTQLVTETLPVVDRPMRLVIVEGTSGVGLSSMLDYTCETIFANLQTKLKPFTHFLETSIFFTQSNSVDTNTPFLTWKSIFIQFLINVYKLFPRAEIEANAIKYKDSADNMVISMSLDHVFKFVSPEFFALRPLLNGYLLPKFGAENHVTSQLFGLPRARKLMELLAEILQKCIRLLKQNIIIVIDDLQSMDTQSWWLLRHLWQKNTGFTVIASFRTENAFRPNSTLSGHASQLDVEMEETFKDPLRVKRIPLKPLDKIDMSFYVCQSLGLDPFDPMNDEISDRVYDLSGGNPLYASELVKTLLLKAAEEPKPGIALQEEAIASALSSPTVSSIRRRSVSNQFEAPGSAYKEISGTTSLRSSICLGEGASFMADSKSKKFCELVRSLKPNHRIEEVIYYKFDRLSSELQLITKIACVAGMNGCPFTAKMIESMMPLAQRTRDSDLESHSGSTRDLLGSSNGQKSLRRRTKSGNLRPESGDLNTSNMSIGSLLLEAELDIPIVPEPKETQRRASYSGGDERHPQYTGRAPIGVSVSGAARRPSFTLTKPSSALGGNAGGSGNSAAGLLSAIEHKIRRPSFNSDPPSKATMPVTPNKEQVFLRTNSNSNLSPLQNSGTNTFTRRKSLSRPSSAKSLKAVDSDISMNNISMSNLNINTELNVQGLLDTLLEQGVFLMDARLGSGMRAVRKTLMERKVQNIDHQDSNSDDGRLLTPGREILSDELFDSIGGLSTVNAEGGEKQMQFRSSLVQVTIYGMMLETQKVYFHERLASYLEKAANAVLSPNCSNNVTNVTNNEKSTTRAKSDDACTVETATTGASGSTTEETTKKTTSSEVSASDWNIQGLHWERAFIWRKAMNCYYRAGKILEDQGAFADSKAQLISAYWMFCEMRRSAGLNFHTKSDVNTEYNPFNVSTNVSPAPTEGNTMPQNGQLQSDLVALSQDDVAKIFNGNTADFEVSIHLLVKLAQSLLTTNERADVIASLYYEALQLVLTTRIGDTGSSLEEQLSSVDGIAASDLNNGPSDQSLAATAATASDKKVKESLLNRLKLDSSLIRESSVGSSTGEPSPQFPPTPNSEVTPIIGLRRHRRGSSSIGSFSPDMPGASFIESLSQQPNSLESSGPNTPRKSGVKKRFSLSLFLPKDNEDSGSSSDNIGNLLLASTFKLHNYDCIFPILSGLIVLYSLSFIHDSSTTFAKKRSIVKLFLSLAHGQTDKNGDPSVHCIRALTCKVWLHFNNGMYQKAISYMEKVLELYDFGRHHVDMNSYYGCDRVMEALTFAAKSALYSGNVVLAMKFTDQAVLLLKRTTHLSSIAMTVLPIVDVLLLLGRVNDSRTVFALYKKCEQEWTGFSLLQPCNAYYEELVDCKLRINRDEAVALFMSYQEMVYRSPLVRVSVLELFLSQQNETFGHLPIDGKIEGETTLRVLRKHARGVECTKAELCYRLALQVCANNTNNRQSEIELMSLFCQEGLYCINEMIAGHPNYSQVFPFDYLRCMWLTAKLTMLSVHYEQNQSVVRAAYQRSIQILRESEIVCITVKSPFMRLMNGTAMYDVCMKGSRCNIDPATNTLFTSYEYDINCCENVIKSTFDEMLDVVAGEGGVNGNGRRESAVQQCCHASPELLHIRNLLVTFVQN